MCDETEHRAQTLIEDLARANAHLFEATESICYTLVVRWPDKTSSEQALPAREGVTAQRDAP